MLSIIFGLSLTLYIAKALTVIGFATWSQNGNIQSDADQDMLMVEACINRYSLESIGAATHSELVEMEIENTSGDYLIGTCGDGTSCEGLVLSKLVDGHSRNCWQHGKQTVSSQVHDNCYHSSSRTTLCVVRLPTSMPTSQTEMPTPTPTQMPTPIPTNNPTQLPTEIVTQSPSFIPTLSPSTAPTANPTTDPTGQPSISPTEMPTFTPTVQTTMVPTVSPTEMVNPSPTYAPTSSPSTDPTVNPTTVLTGQQSISPTEIPTPTPTDQLTQHPTDTPTELSTFKQTFLPTANPTKETESCPETIERLETVIDYLLDYVFCLKHEKDKDNCNGSHYMNYN